LDTRSSTLSSDQTECSARSAGFTLIEVVFALAIMTLAFSSILAVESGSITATTRAKQMNVVGMLAKNQMVETEYKIQGKKFDEIQKEESGTFDSPYQDYRWKTVISQITFPNLATMGGGKPGQDPGSSSGGSGNSMAGTEQLTQIISNYFSKAIRKISVSVLWKQGAKEKSFSLNTFWVDLNYEIPLN